MASVECRLLWPSQRRERFILVGTKEGVAFEWPAPTRYLNGREEYGGPLRSGSAKLPCFSAMTSSPQTRSWTPSTIFQCWHLASPQRITATMWSRPCMNSRCEGACKFLTLHEATRHSPKMLEIIKHSGHNISSLPKGLVSSGFSSCYSRLEPDLPSVTLTVNFVHPASNKCIHPTQSPSLNPPRGGARLQVIPGRIRVRGHTGADREANRQRRPSAVWSDYRELTREAHRVGRRLRRLLAPSLARFVIGSGHRFGSKKTGSSRFIPSALTTAVLPEVALGVAEVEVR